MKILTNNKIDCPKCGTKLEINNANDISPIYVVNGKLTTLSDYMQLRENGKIGKRIVTLYDGTLATMARENEEIFYSKAVCCPICEEIIELKNCRELIK